MRNIKKILCIILCLGFVFVFAGCGAKQNTYDASEYILEVEYKEDFKILQLTDVHIANKDNRQLHYDFMTLTINDANPDMLVISGDLFTFADKAVAKESFEFYDSFGIPWAVTFGNHDEQCYFSVDWMTAYLNEFGSNCVFIDYQDDDVYGNANYAINLKNGSDIVYQLIIMDSNRYNYGEYIGYDYIKPDQIDWYERIVNYTTAESGHIVPSIAIFHIPLPEFNDAWEAAQDDPSLLILGNKQENVCAPKINTGLFQKMLDLGSTKAICCGHDHLNNFVVNYKGIYMAYGVNSTDRIYYDENLLGGRLITVHRDGSLDFEDIIHSYSEVTNK